MQSSSNPSFAAGRSEEPGEGKEGARLADLSSAGRQNELLYPIEIVDGHPGYIGKVSETSWMQRIHEYLIEQRSAFGFEMFSSQMDPHAAQAVAISYFMDDKNLLSIDEDSIDPHEAPPLPITLILTEAYFHAIQGSFQFVQRVPFLEELETFSINTESPSWAQRRFLALANIIWAVGAQWLHQTQLERQGFAEHHLTYYARARALGLDHRIQFVQSDVQKVQGIAILVFYLLNNGSIQT